MTGSAEQHDIALLKAIATRLVRFSTGVQRISLGPMIPDVTCGHHYWDTVHPQTRTHQPGAKCGGRCTPARLKQLAERHDLPLPRNPPQRRVLELLRVPLGVAQLAVLVDASGQQVVEQPLLHLLELGDDLLGLADGLVEGVEDLGDAALFGEGWTEAPRRLPGRLMPTISAGGRPLSSARDVSTALERKIRFSLRNTLRAAQRRSDCHQFGLQLQRMSVEQYPETVNALTEVIESCRRGRRPHGTSC